VIGAALIGEDGVRDVTTAVDIGSKSWPSISGSGRGSSALI